MELKKPSPEPESTGVGAGGVEFDPWEREMEFWARSRPEDGETGADSAGAVQPPRGGWVT